MNADRSDAARRATRVGILGNTGLFVVKASAGLVSGSIALISDALNSLVDVAASVGIAYSVSVARRAPDQSHPFGHHRAEPLAALGVAIFTAILGISVARAAVERLLEGAAPIRAPVWALMALLLSMAGNLVLARYLRRRGEALDSPAILANAVESENDIWTSLAALGGVGGAALGWPVVDPIAGAVVGIWIIVGGYRFGRRNIDYLMGASPGPELVARIRNAALGVPAVKGAHDIRAHYVGHRVHVEVHIEVDQELRTSQSHDVGAEVRGEIERLPEIDRAFVQVDPVLDSTLIIETLALRERMASRIYDRMAERAIGGEAFVALWRALAARSQARAEQMAVIRRLRAAGWHFGDEQLSPEPAGRSLTGLEALEARIETASLSAAEAVGVALQIEADEAAATYAEATVPQDPTILESVAAASPPPPSGELLLGRIAGARAATTDAATRRGLTDLARLVTSSGEDTHEGSVGFPAASRE